MKDKRGLVHYFNPGHEAAVLNASPYYTPNAVQQTIQANLSFLPFWYAGENDLLWLHDEPDASFLSSIKALSTPHIQLIHPNNLGGYTAVLNQAQWAPWGISPQIIHLFKQFNKRYKLAVSLPSWSEALGLLSGREMSVACLRYLASVDASLPTEHIPLVFDQLPDLLDWVYGTQSLCIVKSPYSSSGRGLLWIEGAKEIDRASMQLLHGMFTRQRKLSVELALDKQLDVSLQFYSDGKGGIRFQGLSLFKTDRKGNYQGTWLLSQQEIREHLLQYLPDWDTLFTFYTHHISAFLQAHYAAQYQGNLGVDMLVYATKEGSMRLHPCVEINMRTTMGYLGLSLQQNYLHEGCSGFYSLSYFAKNDSLREEHVRRQKQYPLIIRDGKIQSGYLSLCPLTSKSHYLASIQVSTSG